MDKNKNKKLVINRQTICLLQDLRAGDISRSAGCYDRPTDYPCKR